MTIQSLAILAHNLATLINSGETKNKNTPTATATPTQMPLLKTKPEKTETEKRFLNVAAHRLEREGTIAEREWPVISPCVCVRAERDKQTGVIDLFRCETTHTHSQTILCALFSAAFASLPPPLSFSLTLSPCRCCFSLLLLLPSLLML